MTRQSLLKVGTIVGLLFGALGLLGCEGSEFGNPSATVGITLKYSSGDPATPAVGKEPVVSGVWLTLGSVRMARCTAPGVAPDLKELWSGNEVLDLASGSQALGFQLERGVDYCVLQLRADAAQAPLTPGIPPEMLDHELLVRGTLPEGTRFEVSWANVERRLRFELGGGFQVDPSGTKLIINFETASWFNGLDLAAGVPSADGTIRLDEINNFALFQTFQKNFDQSARLHSDANGNTLVDPTELPFSTLTLE